MCLNRKVLVGVGVVAVGVLLLAPRTFGNALPFLLLAACPLSMLFMMRAMGGGRSSSTEIADRVQEPDHLEVARLRAEVDQLRAELRDREAGGVQDRLD